MRCWDGTPDVTRLHLRNARSERQEGASLKSPLFGGIHVSKAIQNNLSRQKGCCPTRDTCLSPCEFIPIILRLPVLTCTRFRHSQEVRRLLPVGSIDSLPTMQTFYRRPIQTAPPPRRKLRVTGKERQAFLRGPQIRYIAVCPVSEVQQRSTVISRYHLGNCSLKIIVTCPLLL